MPSEYIELFEIAFSVGSSECASSTAAKKMCLNEREKTFSEDSAVSERLILGAALYGTIPAMDDCDSHCEDSRLASEASEASVPRVEAKLPDRSSGWTAFEASKRSLETIEVASQPENVAPDATLPVSVGSLDSISVIPPYESAVKSYWSNGKFIKRFISEPGWLSEDLYLMDSLENSRAQGSLIHLLYRGKEIVIPAKRTIHDYIDLRHPDLKCEYDPNCKVTIRTVKELHSHYVLKHKKEYSKQTVPLKPLVLHWPNLGYSVFVQCGTCPKMISIGWTKHIFGTECGNKIPRWECVNRELNLVDICKESSVKCIDPKSFFGMCSGKTEFPRVKEGFRKSTNVDYKVRNSLRWMELGTKLGSGHRRYYACLSVSLKKIYIGSTGQKLPYRFYKHDTHRSEALEILSQADCVVTEFACVPKADIMRNYHTIKAEPEYYFVNVMKLNVGWTFVNKKIRPDVC